MCVCVCPPPRPWITSGVIWTLCDWLNKFCCLSTSSSYTALAIDTVDGRGLSNEARRELLPIKSKVTLYLPFITR